MTVLMLGKQLELGHYRAEFLTSYGIHVIFPEHKQLAISAIRRGGFDAVILSYTLSNQTAKELIDLVDQVCPDCPLISITSQPWDDRELRPDTTVLDTAPPQQLLEALRQIEARLRKPNSYSGIRRVK
jgi:DNA-binding response OmpR family regulator